MESVDSFFWNYSTGNIIFYGAASDPLGNAQGNLDNGDSPTAVVDVIVYVGLYEGNVYAFNVASGAKLWNYTTGDGTLSTPTVADGVVYVGLSDDNIYALNATNGVELWSSPTSGAVDSPAVVNGVLYVGGGNNVYALRVSAASSPSPKPSNTLPIIIGVVVLVVVTVATVVVLMFQKRLKKNAAKNNR